MNLVLIAAFLAVCGAAKLDRTYLPPSSADTAGGSPGSLQAPLTRTSEQGLEAPKLPTGSYTNNFQGVVVDAAAPGTRASADAELSGLGGPRPTYGSTDSKVGDAAFRGSAGFRTPSFGHMQTNGGFPQGQLNFEQASSIENKSERPQASNDRNSNILAFNNDVSSDNYSYGFETDNGIAVGENGVAVNGVQAEGGYSYQGDDGQVYKVTYTADEGGYRPQGAHLPTPHPIPEEILKSIEQNAKEEAAGLVDDGSYDAQKYNADSDYTHDGGNNQYNGGQLSQFGKRPESDATASSTIIDQNSQAFKKPGTVGSNHFGSNVNSAFNGESSQYNGNIGFGKPGTVGSNQFGSNIHSAFNSQSLQDNGNIAFGKPTAGSNQFGSHIGQTSLVSGGSGAQNTYSGIQGHVNGKPGSQQFNSGSTDSHSFNGQSTQFNTNPVTTQNGDAYSQGGHLSQHLSGHQKNEVPQTSGLNVGSSLSQSQFSSHFEQQSTSAQFGNQSPNTGGQLNKPGFSTQPASNPTKPLFGQNSGEFANSGSTQTQFGSQQGTASLTESNQGQTQSFGKPSNNDDKQGQYQSSSTGFSQTSSSNTYYNKPTSGNTNQFGSANPFPQAGHVEQTNEYLPPLSSNKHSEKPSAPGYNSYSSLNSDKNDQVPNFTSQNGQTTGFSSASASSSVGQPALQPQQAKPFNTFDHTQFNHQTGSSQSPVNTQQSALQSSHQFELKPTSEPDTELTTPLEPNEKPSSSNSQFSSQTTTNFGTFSSKPVINQPQTQFGYQGNSVFSRPSTSQTLSPSFPTSSSQSQFGSASTQSTFPVASPKVPEYNNKPNFPQNSFGSNQASNNQGVDNSYQYNQPSKPFGAPAVRPQGSKFPSSPSYQFNGVASQYQSSSQQNSFQSNSGSPSLAQVAPTSATQFNQAQGVSSSNFNGITQAAISPFPAASPTPSSQIGTTINQFGSKPNFNQQQTFSNQQNKPNFSQQPTGQQSFPISNQNPNPSQTQAQFGQSETTPESSKGSSQQQTTVSQQYQGTIYQYNKPAEVLPAPTQTDSSSSQTIQTGVTSESKPTISQNIISSLAQQGLSQGSNFGAQSNKPSGSAPSTIQFGQHTQTDHASQTQSQQTTGFQFGAQPAVPFGTSSTSSQIAQTAQSAPASSSFPQQNYQTGSFKPFGAASQSTQSSFGSKPQFGSQTQAQFTQTTQSFGSSPTNQAGHVPGAQPQFSSVGNAASSQGNGYFYPKNPKPHFGETAQHQFGQNPQFGSQLGSTLFNQNTQSASSKPSGTSNQQFSQAPFGSTAQPQFATQSQTQFGQNTQTQFGQKTPNSTTKPFSQPQFNQASSHAVASGQASASAHASSLPQPQYKPFGVQKPESQDQSGQGTQFGTQSYKPFSNNNNAQVSNEASKPYGALNSNPFGANGSTGSNANSPCCQGTKDSTPAQSTNRPSVTEQDTRFPGIQNFNAQSLAGKGEEFGGPRQPPRFDDQTGYHY